MTSSPGIFTQRTDSRLRRGFTLVELLVVVAISIVLMAIALPTVKYSIDESKLREASRQVQSYFSMAKARAAGTGRPCGVFMLAESVPGGEQVTQLYLAEVPPPYTGDVLNARAWISNDGGSAQPLLPQNASGTVRWVVNPAPAGSAASLQVLLQPNEIFAIQFDFKGTIYPATIDNLGNVYITGNITPPQANGIYQPDPMLPNYNPNAGYPYTIYRNPRRIGAPLALPRGTAIDLEYSGFGSSGTEFSAAIQYVSVMFAPSGRVTEASFRYLDINGNVQTLSGNPTGTLHFLVGRPERVGLALPESNLVSGSSLWVSVARLTGSVVTTDNAPIIDLPVATPQQRQLYMTIAREFAITQDTKGGR